MEEQEEPEVSAADVWGAPVNQGPPQYDSSGNLLSDDEARKAALEQEQILKRSGGDAKIDANTRRQARQAAAMQFAQLY
jgi:hypothetical protein